ncbi:hypothetical protein CUR178_07210 [Leishmania enriettii]|uniref:Uncharacterized protein n=1 Tax=Leishmania enriettii TaxID=5663 RepID=A0A836H2I1_LEIEN|nr:hypothetical protein CUR178_07210 [Leishmania enriettii]
MALLDEARRQLDAEVGMYVRSMQPTPHLAPSLKNGVVTPADAMPSKALAHAADSAAAAASTKALKSGVTEGVASGEPHRSPHTSSKAKAPNAKRSCTRLQAAVKKLLCATLVTTQVLSTDDSGVSNLCRSASKSALTTRPTKPSTCRTTAARQSVSGTSARGKAADTDTGEDSAASRAGSRPSSPRSPLLSRSQTTSLSSPTRGLVRTASSLTNAVAAPPTRGNGAAHSTSANLRRVRASLAFTQDCLRYASTLAEAGLGSEARSCFLQPIAQDITSLYEPVLARCVEPQPRADDEPLSNAGSASAGAAGTTTSAAASIRTPRRHRVSLGGGRGREDRKLTTVVGGADKDGSGGSKVTGQDVDVDEDSYVTVDLDAFAPDPPLPLALRLHKCVLGYRALALYIRFGEIITSDVYGDAAGLATALEACACVEQLVALEQRVLRTPAFNAAGVLRREAAKLKEDVSHATSSRPKTVNAIVVAGCRLVDLMAEPLTEAPTSVSMVRSARTHNGEVAPRIYAVEETAAPVLFAMRQYVANMCQRLLAYLSSTLSVSSTAMSMVASPPSAAHAKDGAGAIARRIIEALRTSISMSELNHSDTHGAVSAPPSTPNALIRGIAGRTCLPLAAVEYLPWRLYEYSLLQNYYTHLQGDPSSATAAVVAAQRALHQVLHLMELQYFDPAPPPASSVHLLETAVQQCAGQLLVATWRATLVQDGVPSVTRPSSAVETASKAMANGGGGESPCNSTAAAATASSAMACITTLIQKTVGLLLSMQWSSLSSTSAPSLADLPPRAAHQRGHGLGSHASGMSGTRLLVVLWTYIAEVQQQCMVLGGRLEVADALRAAATSDVHCDEKNAVVADASDAGGGGGLGLPSTTDSPSPARESSGEKPTKKGKPRNSISSATASGKHKLAKAGEATAQAAVEQAAAAAAAAVAACASSSLPPTSIAHQHPSVVALAARFPRAALELVLKLTTIIEAAGAAPRYAGEADSAQSGGISEGAIRASMGAQRRLSKNSAALGVKGNADRKSLKGTRSRTASIASFSETAASSPGGGAWGLFTGVQLRSVQVMYRGCVEALEVLLHGAAMAATELVPVGAEASAAPPASVYRGGGTRLGALTHAAVLREAEDILLLDDGVDVLAGGATETVGGEAASMFASVDAANVSAAHLEQRGADVAAGALAATPAPSASLMPQCFLYNVEDARCLSRFLTWDALFLSSPLVAPETAAVLAGRGALDGVEDGVQFSAEAFRTLAVASSQLSIVLRVGVALGLWLRSQRQQAATTARSVKGGGSMKLNGSSTALLSAPRPSASATRSIAIEASTKCTELLRVLTLNVMLQQHRYRVANDESALTATLRTLAVVECTLSGADAPATSRPPPMQSHAEENAEHTRLSSIAKVGWRLWQMQRRRAKGGDSGGDCAREVALREFTESAGRLSLENVAVSGGNSSDGADRDALLFPSASPPSLRLYRASATFLDSVTAALCPPSPPSSSADGAGEKSDCVSVTAIAAGGLHTPMAAALSVLKPVVAEVAPFLLRCGGELRSQWQRHRALRQVRQATIICDDPAQTGSSVDAKHAPLSVGEREVDEEAAYATVALYALTSMWRCGAGDGTPLSDDRSVGSLVRSVESAFLQLVPALPSSSASATETHIPPAQLARLIAHGLTARRLADRTRGQLQRRVESLLAHAVPMSDVKGPGSRASTPVPTSSTAASCEKFSNPSPLSLVRDAFTELTSLWVTVRWQLARLQAYKSSCTAQHMDLETLQARQKQQQVYGRTTAKELRILRALEAASPVLPVTAKDEEVRLRRWVAEQRQLQSQPRMAAGMHASLLLLDALVCTALVPLNAADPSAQQRLLDEAIRGMRQAEEECVSKKSLKRGASFHVAYSHARGMTAATAEASVLYSPLLLWCYVAEACSAYGMHEQAERVRAVLDARMLEEMPSTVHYTYDGGALVAVTTSFIQRLMLQPKWSALQASSTITRLAYCRALSTMADGGTSKAASRSDALGSLQIVYRLVLALQIQRMPSAAEAHSAGLEGNEKGTIGGLARRRETLSSSPLAVDTAQQLVSAILDYFARSSGSTDISPTPKTAAAPLLLPPLVALSEVLLELPHSSPRWADASIQLLAVRVLTLFKEQLVYVLSSATTAVGAAACSPASADAMLRLLWATLVHVWNNVLRNPNVRQRRLLLAMAQETQWTRRVLDGHQRLMHQQRAAVTETAVHAESEDKGGGGGKSGRHARNAGNSGSGATAGAHSDSTASESPVPPLDFPGVEYLAVEDALDGRWREREEREAKSEKGDGGARTISTAPAPLSAATAAAGATDSSKQGPVAEPNTLLMHASAPAELIELFVSALFHMPALRPLMFSSATDGGGLTDADAGTEGSAGGTALEAVGAIASPKQHRRGKPAAEEAEQQQQQRLLSLDSPADFVCFAGQHAARVLRLQPAAQTSDAASSPSASGANSVLLRLQGVPAVYADVAAALRQYGAMVAHGAATALSATTGTRGVGGSRGHPGGGAASSVLIEALAKYKHDPAYAEVAVHVVREMLTMCSDAEDSIDNGNSGGGGVASSSTGTTTAPRKRNVANSTPSAELTITSITARSTAVTAAVAIIADARLVMRTVREQAEQNRRCMEAHLSTVDSETRAWLARDGYALPSAPQQQAAVNAGAGEASTTAVAGGQKDGRRSAAASKKRLADRGAAGKKSTGKSGAPNRGESDDNDEEDETAKLQVDEAPSYTIIKRVWSFTEQQKLSQLTCAIAWWRRRRAARTLRHRYTQYNMPFMAQMHLYEAALLHMGATAKHTAMTHEYSVQELLRLVCGGGSVDGGTHIGAAVERNSAVPSHASSSTAVATAHGGVPGSSSPATLPNNISGAPTEEPVGPAQITMELLQHCARAALLFQYLWLPTRASTAVQLAVRHLQESRVALPWKGLSVSSSAAMMALVKQLLTVPLFCIAAVQRGYWDARRDVHARVLQPAVMKVGADVSYHRRFRFHRNVPSLLSLTSLLGQHEEMQSMQEARALVLRQRQLDRLQLRLCVELEAATRAEAERDEVQAKVPIVQRAQELLPHLRQSAAVKASLLAAVEFFTSSAAGLDEARSRHGNPPRRPNPPQALSAPSRESFYAAAAEAATKFQYFTFEGALLGSGATARSDARGATSMPGPHTEASRGTGEQPTTCSGSVGDDATGRYSADAVNYGRDMREANLIEQLLSLARVFVSVQPAHCAATCRMAQSLTAGRYAEELLPLVLQIELEERGEILPETRAAYDEAIRNVPEGLLQLRAARTARAQLPAREEQASDAHQKLLPPQRVLMSAKSASAAAMLTHGLSASDTSSSWKVVKAYQRAAQNLRAAGLLQPLGECLCEQGDLYCANSHVSDAAKRWSDALDCFLATPHALEDWHRHRTAPPAPPSGRRSLEELLWISAALSALGRHAFPTDSPRATDAKLLCALLVHQYWRLPGVVSTTAASDGDSDTVVERTQHPALPPAQYGLLDVHHASAPFTDALRPTAIDVSQQRAPTGMPGALTDVTRRLISAAQSLLTKPPYVSFSSESAVLAAFSDFIATVVLQDVELTVEARLVRAAAAANLGSFSVAMQHIYGVCVGAGLPQPMSALLGADEALPGFYSLGCAAASPAGATAAAVAASLSSPPPSSSTAVLPLFYRDEESPSSPHNTASVRAFLAACLPGLPLDAVAKHSIAIGNNEVGGATALPLSTGVLASAALEERYGACLTRRLQLAIAELLVRLGTCDSAFLLMDSPTVAAAAISSLATITSASAPSNLACSVGSSGTAQNRASPFETTAPPCAGSAGSRSSPSPPPPTAGRGDRPSNACTEACCYASTLLQSLASADVCFILTGQHAPSGVEGGAAVVGATRPSGSSAAATALLSEAPKARAVISAHRAAPSTSGAVAAAPLSDASKQAGVTDGHGGVGAAPSSSCVAWLGTLGAIRQHALLLSAELLAAQGHYSACVRRLAVSIAEHNEARECKTFHQKMRASSSPAPSPSHAASATTHSLSQSQAPPQPGTLSVSPSSAAPAPHALLKGLGFQSGNQALSPFVFVYEHWVRVWLLMCRCYSHLRHYPQLEEAAGTQGLLLCIAFGVEGVKKSDDSSTYRDASFWIVFQLYRLYALMQMGRVREAGDVIAALELGHRAPATTSSSATVTVDSPLMGVAEDRCVAVEALKWWRKHQGEPLESASSLGVPEQVLRVAIAEHGVLPWRPSTCPSSPQHYVLVSPSARSILPSLVLSRCATTATLWRLHDMMNHYALEQQQQQQQHQPSLTTITAPIALGGVCSGDARSSRRAPHQRPTTLSRKRVSSSITTDQPSTSLTSSVLAPAPSNAAASLMQALEVVSPQYSTSAHPSCWLESQSWAAQLKVREVCARLLASSHESEAEAEGAGRGVSVAVTEAKVANESVFAAPHTGVPPLLFSREDALRALPTPVRDACDQLLRVLQCYVELPVQRHARVRAVLLDLTRVVSTYARVRSARQGHTPLSQGPPCLSASATAEASFVSQLESIAAACVLLAGLVSDMEQRVRTGADSLRGYATDPRVTAAAIAISEAKTEGQGQAPWPESLWAALQRTQDTVGRLTPMAHRNNADDSGAAAPADVLSHPFYNGAAPLVGSAGADSDRVAGAGRAHKNSAKRLSGCAAIGALATLSAARAAQLSVPTMALTYATLCNETAAARALTPVTDALEHDVAQQLLVSHLQRLSAPPNCTYLCYRDQERQVLLENIGAVLTQQQMQQQQQQQSSRRSGSGNHFRRAGPAGASPSTNAAAGALGGGSSLPNVRLTEADMWKALAPPVLLTGVPNSLFSALGADALGAPLYNSVAAAAVCIVARVGPEGGASATVGRETSDQAKGSQPRTSPRGVGREARWQLYLSVSPLQDAEVAAAPPALLPGAAAASLENCTLLPPSHIHTAAAVGTENWGAAAASATTTASTGTFGTGVSRAGKASRYFASGSSAGPASSHGSRVGGLGSLLTSSTISSAERGGGDAWWPPLIARATISTREVLVPSTNWALLDGIQHYQQQHQRELSRQDTDGAVKPPPSSSLAAPASPSTRGVRKLGRKSSLSSPAAVLTTAACGAAFNAAVHRSDGVVPPCEPEPLRWACVSLEVSGSAVRTLRQHLRAVRACMRRKEAEEVTAGGVDEDASVRKSGGSNSKGTEDAVSGATVTGAATLATVEVHGVKKRDDHSSVVASLAAGGSSAESDPVSDHAAVARCALAAAVAQAQSALRSRVMAGGSGGGGLGGVAPGSSSASPPIAQGAAGDSGARAGFNSSYPVVSPSAAVASGSGATSPSTSAGRKTTSKTCASGRHSSYGNGLGGHGNGATGAGGADGLQTGPHFTHNDLADAARARQVAERRRRLQQLEEELEEAKSSLLMELLETIVSAACASSLCPATAVAILDEARIEADVQRLLPRCALSGEVIGFLEEWLGGHAVLNVHGNDTNECTGSDGGDNTDGDDSFSSGSRTTSLRFYNTGLHEWMQRISRYVAEQQQPQQ